MGSPVHPARPATELCDTDLPGLYIEVRSTSPGTGTYYLRYKSKAGKTCHQKIGRSTDMSLHEARQRAKTLKAEIQLGADPRGDMQAKKAAITYDAFFTDHYLPYAKARKRSWQRDEELYRLRIRQALGDKRISESTRQQVQNLHTSLLCPRTCAGHLRPSRQAHPPVAEPGRGMGHARQEPGCSGADSSTATTRWSTTSTTLSSGS